MVCSWTGVAFKVVAVDGTEVSVVSIVHSCRVHRERLGAGWRGTMLCAREKADAKSVQGWRKYKVRQMQIPGLASCNHTRFSQSFLC